MELNRCISSCFCDRERLMRGLPEIRRAPLNCILQGFCDHISTDVTGDSPLHSAVRSGDLRTVKKILKGGASLRETNRFGETPLHLAAKKETNFKIVQKFLQQGACANVENNLGNTPLHYAVEYESSAKNVEELLKHGADPCKRNIYGSTPLHIAAGGLMSLQAFKELIKYGACIDEMDRDGDTPLNYILNYGNILGMVNSLLEVGPDVNKANFKGETPLYKAVRNTTIRSPKNSGKLGVVQELLQHGALVNVADSAGKTPLDLAVEDIALKLLIKYTLIQDFQGDYRNLFNSKRYEDLKDNNILARFFEDCVSEVAQMKTTMVNARLSLYKLVTTKSNAVIYPSNETVKLTIGKRALISNYPVYSDVISSKVKCASVRATLLNKYIFTYSVLIEKKKAISNYDCISVTAQYLSNEDMCNFILASHNFIYDIDRYYAFSNYHTTALKKRNRRTRFAEDPANGCAKKTKLE